MAESYLSGMHTEEGRRAVAEVLLALFRRWEIAEGDQAKLLGMQEVEPLWQGTALPNETAVLERAGLLLAIERAIQQQFAEQPKMADRWVTLPNIWLQGRSPLDKMLEGDEGIRQIHDLLPHPDKNPTTAE
ncbi:MAG: antitoxin Xre/MbcA/ParS toxin-binding domain-containing protein [Pseudomonadota bacterium]